MWLLDLLPPNGAAQLHGIALQSRCNGRLFQGLGVVGRLPRRALVGAMGPALGEVSPETNLGVYEKMMRSGKNGVTTRVIRFDDDFQLSD